MNSEIRKDYLQDNYAVIAPRRGKRPGNNVACPFCPKNLNKKSVILPFIKNKGVAVIKNIFPAFTIKNKKAYGTQEVVIDAPDHNKSFSDLSVNDISFLLNVFGKRVNAIKKDKKINYIEVFKNSGALAGASKLHEHSQIIAINFIPPHLEDKTLREHSYQAKTGHCPYCDIIKKEKKSKRMIFSDAHIVAFAPFASQHAFEARIFPHRHIDNISLLNNAERLSFAKVLKSVTTSIKKLGVPYNFYMHERVNDSDQHFYIKITPRGAHWAGFELATGLIINPIPPETAAKFFKKQFKV